MAYNDPYIDQSGGVVDTSSTPSSGGPVSAANYGPDVQGGNPVGREYNGQTVEQMRVSVSPSTANPRPPAEQASAKESPGLDPNQTYSAAAPGPITAAARTLDVTAAPAGIGGTYAQSAAFDQAQGRQDMADRSQAAARVAAAPSSRDIERMQSEARVDKWKLENAKMDAAGHIGRNPRSVIGAATAIAAGSQSALSAAQAQNQAAVVNPLRNPVQEEIQKQQSLISGQGANTQTALAGQQLQKGQFDLKHQALIQGLADQLGTTDMNSPAYGRLLSSYRALNGLGSNWKTQVASGETYANPDNPAGPPLQRGARIVSTNELTGETHEVPLGQQKQGAQKPPLTEFMQKAGAANPKMTADQLKAKYLDLYGQ